MGILGPPNDSPIPLMTLLHRRFTARPLVGRLLAIAVVVVLTALAAPPTSAQSNGGTSAQADDQGSSTGDLGDGTTLKAEYDEVLGQEAKLAQAADVAAQRRAALTVQMAGAQKELGTTRLQLAQATSVFMDRIRTRNETRSLLRAAEHRVAVATAELRKQ